MVVYVGFVPGRMLPVYILRGVRETVAMSVLFLELPVFMNKSCYFM